MVQLQFVADTAKYKYCVTTNSYGKVACPGSNLSMIFKKPSNNCHVDFT